MLSLCARAITKQVGKLISLTAKNKSFAGKIIEMLSAENTIKRNRISQK
jgi:hypothetical protein